MFQALIDQAHGLIQRLHASAEQGRDAVAEGSRVRVSELEAWDTASRAIVDLVFGGESAEAARWRALAERRAALVGEAMRKDMKRGEFFGLIDYFHLAIGALLEFEARYAHQGSGAPAANGSVALPESPAPPHALANGHRPAAPANGPWELTIAVSAATYRWLAEVAARDPAEGGAEAAARLAASIVERVAANTRAEKRGA
jgi:hypothetical protein